MQKLVNQGRYKTIGQLRLGEGGEVFTALNIENARQDEVLICRYRDSKEVRRLLPLFYETKSRGCDELVEIFNEFGGFCVVFKRGNGQPLEKILPCADPLMRRRIQEALFSRALELSCMPEELCNAAVRPENALWQEAAGELIFQMVLDSRLMKSGDSSLVELSKMSERILRRGFFTMAEELDFLDRLRTSQFKTVGEGYTAWRELCVCTAQSYEEHYRKNGISLLVYGIKTWFSRRRTAGKYKKQYRY